MKRIPLLSAIFILPAASLLAQGQSEIEILRARVDVQDRRISQLENNLSRLNGSTVTMAPAKAVTKTAPKAVPVTSIEAASTTTREYVVAKGDTLTRIAHRHQTTVAGIKKENGLKSDGLRIGQKLRIPAAADSTQAGRKPVSNPETAKPKPKTAIAQQPSNPAQYKVKAGDTFYGIARQYKMSEAALQAANPKAQPTRLQVGQTLVIDGSVTPTARTKTAAVAKKAPASKPVASAPVQKAPVAKSSTKKTEIRTITVHQQMTYGAFATQHGASTTQLNSLNGLNLSKSTLLAKGSELYVPQF
jgi:LysM repeat protein